MISGLTWNLIVELGADSTAFSDLTVLPASSYMYRVYAFNAAGNSAFSNELTVSTPPGAVPVAPSNLLTSNNTPTSLTLSWMDNATTEDGFYVQISTDKNFTLFLEYVAGPNATSWVFTGLTANTKYYMRVAAFNGAGSSQWSPVFSDKTLK